jgi:neutral ceramidase
MNAARRLLCLGLLSLLISVPASGAEPLRIGVAETDITPPLRFPMAGYYHERLATGTLDPLKARAIVFRGEPQQAAWVACDIIGIAADLSAEVRRQASAKTGIPVTNIVLTATHTHTAPDYTKDLYDYLGAAAQPGAAEQHPYAVKLIGGIVQAIVQAHEQAQSAVLEVGSAQQTTPVSFNRRFVMQDGSVRTWMRLDSPGVVRAAGPIDPEIGMVLVRTAEGNKPLSLLSNFALHLDTVGGTQWSADYPHDIEQAVRKSLGESVVSIFGNGCCGDINHCDPVSKERNKTDFIGGSLGATIVSGLPRLRRIEQPALRVLSTTVRVPLQEVTAEQLAKACELVPRAKAGQQVDFFELVIAYKALILDQLRHRPPQVKTPGLLTWGLSHGWAGSGDSLPVEVQVICLGRAVAVVCLPGEVFVDLGLAIKRASPFETTLVVELANCVETIYVPTRAAYAGGSYEVTNSALQPGAGEMLVEAALRLLREAARE